MGAGADWGSSVTSSVGSCVLGREGLVSSSDFPPSLLPPSLEDRRLNPEQVVHINSGLGPGISVDTNSLSPGGLGGRALSTVVVFLFGAETEVL